MGTIGHGWDNDRAKSAVAVAVIHALLGFALIRGLGVDLPARIADELKTFTALAPAPPPLLHVVPAKSATKKPNGGAAPPNLGAKATPVVAPKPVTPLPTRVAVADKPSIGVQSFSGAAPFAGPGIGAGGVGTGTGSGTGGNGDGAGDETPLRLIKGDVYSWDLPAQYRESDATYVIHMVWDVGPDGRVHRCTVTRSSGYPEVDDITCRLVMKRYRYSPTRDGSRRAIADQVDAVLRLNDPEAPERR